jgi:hypothetical protein
MKSAKWVLAFGLLLGALDAGAQAVGRVLIAAGEVAASRGGRDVPLVTGAMVERGDIIYTGRASSAQIRFADESIVAMRAESRFEVTEFSFTGSDDGASQSIFNLVRGGLRTLTGLIGRSRQDRYSMRTPLATVGIRGTTYSLVHCQKDCIADDGSTAPDGTYGVVFDGRVTVSNPVGEREFGVEEAFYVADLRSLPQALISRPGFLRDRLEARARREDIREQLEARSAAVAAMREQLLRLANVAEARFGYTDARVVGQVGTVASPIVVVTDLRDPNGNVALIGPGLGAGVSFSTVVGPIAGVDGGRGTVIELDGNRGVLERFVFNGGAQTGQRNNAFVSEGGSLSGDGGGVWGRWGPGATVTANNITGSPSTGVHFFFGNLTPETLLTGTVPSGATAVRYDFANGTRPTDEQGNTGQFIAGNFIVNFVQRSISGNLAYAVDRIGYNLPVPQTPLVTGQGFIGFFVDQRNAGTWVNTQTNAGGSIDRFMVSGLFLGSRAQGLGVTFATEDSIAGRTAGVGLFRCVSGGCR